MFSFVPKSIFESQNRLLEKMLPFGREPLGDGKCVDPERLDLDRLTDARRNYFAVNLCIHPGKLNAGNTCSKQPIVICPNVKARSGLISEQDSLNGVS